KDHPAGGVDAVVTPAHRTRQAHLPGAQAEMRGVPHLRLLPRGSEVFEGGEEEKLAVVHEEPLLRATDQEGEQKDGGDQVVPLALSTSCQLIPRGKREDGGQENPNPLGLHIKESREG